MRVDSRRVRVDSGRRQSGNDCLSIFATFVEPTMPGSKKQKRGHPLWNRSVLGRSLKRDTTARSTRNCALERWNADLPETHRLTLASSWHVRQFGLTSSPAYRTHARGTVWLHLIVDRTTRALCLPTADRPDEVVTPESD